MAGPNSKSGERSGLLGGTGMATRRILAHGCLPIYPILSPASAGQGFLCGLHVELNLQTWWQLCHRGSRCMW